MESLLAVEKEIDKALEVFEVFYDEIDNEIDKVMEKISLNSNDISTSK
jgi:prefoldin subunit 5